MSESLPADQQASFKERRQRRVNDAYAYMKNNHPKEYTQVIHTAEALQMNHGLDMHTAADVETAFMQLAMEWLTP